MNNLQKLFETLTNKKVESYTVTKWLDEIHDKSIQPNDYTTFLVNTSEYIDSKVLEFKITYFNRVGYYLSEDTIDQFKAQYKGKIIETSDIYAFVSDTAEFKDKYASAIKANCENYGIDTNTYMDMFLYKFQTDVTYTFENLEQEIQSLQDNNSFFEIANGNKKTNNNTLPALYESTFNCTPSKEDLLILQDMDLLLMLATEKQPPRSDNEIFYHVFGRPMYIEEYFKYVKFQKLKDSQKKEYYENILKTHIMNFNRLSQIITSFQTDPFDEYDYVSNFLFEIDNPTFFDTIIDKILESEQYNKSMKTHVSYTYEKLFGTVLIKSEIDYIFNIVKAKKLGIYDESLHLYLVEFKKDSDDIHMNITNVYQKVLERNPDQYELDTHSEMYRQDNNRQLSNSKLEPMLIQSLEFHDIMKQQIASIYYEKKKTTNIQPSVLYSILDILIKRITTITLDNIVEVINKNIT